MAKISIVPWSSEKGPDGASPLYLVIRHKGRRATIALEPRIKAKDWNETQDEVRKSNRDHKELNEFITNTKARARSAVNRLHASGEAISARRIKKELTERKEEVDDFLAYYGEQLKGYEKRKQWATHAAYRVALVKLTAYMRRQGRRTLPFDMLTVAFLEGFKTHLISHYGNKKNTIAKNLASIRTVLYQAIREDRFPQEKNPFFQIHLEKERSSKNKPIGIEEIWKIWDADLGDGRINDVRNIFIFAFFNTGMRVSDALQFMGKDVVKQKGIWRIEFEMEKTDKASFSMPLLPIPEVILLSYGWPDIKPNKYIFPFLPQRLKRGQRETFEHIKTKTALLNKYLKKIQEICEIDTRLTTHVARHSWSHHLDMNDFEIQKIQETLRHSDAKTTQVYIESMRSGRMDERLMQILERPDTL